MPRAGRAAPDPADYAWRTNLGAQVAMGTMLRDEAGRTLPFGAVFGGKPLILDIGYFHCPTLCGVVRGDMLAALAASGLDSRDYALAAVSIDPAETAKDAADAKAADLGQVPSADPAGWHYLTGSAAAIGAITTAVGFPSSYDPALGQFLHPAGLVVLTKDGVVSTTLQGVGYSGGDLRAAVLRAGTGGVAAAALPVLLLCFHFDSGTGRYTLAIEKVLRLAAGLTVVGIAGLLLVLHRRRHRVP